MSGCSAAVASAVASMASSVSLLAAMITEEAAAAYLARRKRSRFPTWCESVSPHCSYRVPSSLRSRWSPHCSYLRVSGVCGRRTVPTFVSPCTIMVSPLPGRRVLLCASPGIRSWSLCCRSVLNRRSPATNRFRAIPRSVSATVPDRPGSFPLCCLGRARPPSGLGRCVAAFRSQGRSPANQFRGQYPLPYRIVPVLSRCAMRCGRPSVRVATTFWCVHFARQSSPGSAGIRTCYGGAGHHGLGCTSGGRDEYR